MIFDHSGFEKRRMNPFYALGETCISGDDYWQQ